MVSVINNGNGGHAANTRSNNYVFGALIDKAAGGKRFSSELLFARPLITNPLLKYINEGNSDYPDYKVLYFLQDALNYRIKSDDAQRKGAIDFIFDKLEKYGKEQGMPDGIQVIDEKLFDTLKSVAYLPAFVTDKDKNPDDFPTADTTNDKGEPAYSRKQFKTFIEWEFRVRAERAEKAESKAEDVKLVEDASVTPTPSEVSNISPDGTILPEAPDPVRDEKRRAEAASAYAFEYIGEGIDHLLKQKKTNTPEAQALITLAQGNFQLLQEAVRDHFKDQDDMSGARNSFIPSEQLIEAAKATYRAHLRDLRGNP